MKKIPYGIFDYKELITEGYEYIDKTMYIQKLEAIGKTLIYLRPGRFGKSLFTSMLSYYYDINKNDEFETLFKRTYIYDNPTPEKNGYYILKFDFSNINTSENSNEQLKDRFIKKVVSGIKKFNIDYNVNFEFDSSDIYPSEILLSFFTYFSSLKLDKKLYILIDEYDNFTNAILEGNAENFIDAVGEDGFVKTFYACIKEYIGLGIVGRTFITGICPITLNSMTTGFNIATDISTHVWFNSMVGLTHEEVLKLIEGVDSTTKEQLFDLMLKNYDGYKFSRRAEKGVFNATLTMYFLKNYTDFNEVPDDLFDNNIVVNYGKIDNLLKLQGNKYYKEIIERILTDGEIESQLKTSFNLIEEFTRYDLISLLYYFGYLTIKSDGVGNQLVLQIPNEIMRMTYSNYFLKLLRDIDIQIDDEKITKSIIEIRDNGSINTITAYVSEILDKQSNRILMNFNEKSIQWMYYSLLMNKKEFTIRLEQECIGGGYADVFIKGKEEYTPYNIIIELKYIKEGVKNKKKLIEEKCLEGIEQLKRYKLDAKNLKKYLVVFVGRKVEVLEEVVE